MKKSLGTAQDLVDRLGHNSAARYLTIPVGKRWIESP